MSDTEILNWIVREVNRGRVIFYDWQREELLCEIKVRRMRDKEERDAQIHNESEASRIDVKSQVVSCFDAPYELHYPQLLIYGKRTYQGKD